MFDYFGELIERKRAEPGDDMISSLIEGEDGDALDETEMKGMCALMLFAGHETTTTTITSAVKVLLDNPDHLALLRADPAQSGKCVEEVLRYEGAIKLLHRWVLEDLEIRGQKIKAGERVLIVNSAANRDPRKFEDPDRFRIMRHPNPHVAFGKGVHACIGAMLARIEMRVAVRRLVERLPGLRYADPEPVFRWNPSLASRGLAELRIAHDGQGSRRGHRRRRRRPDRRRAARQGGVFGVCAGGRAHARRARHGRPRRGLQGQPRRPPARGLRQRDHEGLLVCRRDRPVRVPLRARVHDRAVVRPLGLREPLYVRKMHNSETRIAGYSFWPGSTSASWRPGCTRRRHGSPAS
jgi:cytochrome P450